MQGQVLRKGTLGPPGHLRDGEGVWRPWKGSGLEVLGQPAAPGFSLSHGDIPDRAPGASGLWRKPKLCFALLVYLILAIN